MKKHAYNGSWRLLCGLLLISLLPTPAIAWQVSGSSATGIAKQIRSDNKSRPKDIEEELFKGLDKLPPLPESTGRPQPKPGKTDRGPAIDSQRQRRLTQGEDLGEQGIDSWSRIGDSMRNVEGRIAAGNLGKETQQLQKIIAQDLARLTKQLRQQSNNSSFRPGTGAASSASSQNPDSQPDSAKPATDSTARIGQDSGSSAESEEVEMLMDRLWGQLPARIQTQLRGAAVDQFLPKYQLLLEQFYRRLGEQEDDDS